MKIVSWNIHHGEGTDGRIDLDRVAEVLRCLNADVILLQEVDVSTNRSGGVNQAEAIAGKLGMAHRFGRAMDFDGGHYGQAVLSRWRPSHGEVFRLPGDGEPRIALRCRVFTPHKWVDVVTLHLDHASPVFRKEQADRLIYLLEPGPVVIGGDFNASIGDPPVTAFRSKGFTLHQKAKPAPTCEDRDIDHFVSRGFPATETEVWDGKGASDHLPVGIQI